MEIVLGQAVGLVVAVSLLGTWILAMVLLAVVLWAVTR